MATFNDFPLHTIIQRNLAEHGLTNPTEIQEKAFAHLLTAEKIDFHGQAQTGTGKTLAFGIPLIQSINPQDNKTQALVVAPTRELVLQICESLKKVAAGMGVYVEPIYGGVSLEAQMRALKRGVHIVVGTPGRLNDHLRRKTLWLGSLRTLVLDEADIMLDMGFKEEIDEILAYVPKDRQVWLFSATVKPGIRTIKEEHMKDPVSVRVAASNVTAATTKQYFCIVPRRVRLQALARFIDSEASFYGLIFCQTKMLADEVCQELNKRGYAVNALHGDMNQPLRNKVIKGFKNREFKILVATDVAARGIDIADLTHVVNYSLPEDQESYVHRIGRTGRAGKDGVAITLINSSEVRRLQQLANRFKATISPLDVPTLDAIAKLRFDKAIEQIDHLCNTNPTTHACSQRLLTLLQERSNVELVTALHNLISKTVLKNCGQEAEDVQFGSTDKAMHEHRPNHYNDPNGQEIMLNVGTDDGIHKGDVLRYVQATKTLKGQRIGRVHVIKRRSFVTIEPHLVPELIKELHGKQIRGRRVYLSVSQ